MNDGMLPLFCATECPFSSVKTQAKSLASFDRVENAVRMMHLGRLVDDRRDPAPQDFDGDGVEHVFYSNVTTMLPDAITSAVPAGPMTSVEPGSSTSAGPRNVAPAASRSRS